MKTVSTFGSMRSPCVCRFAAFGECIEFIVLIDMFELNNLTTTAQRLPGSQGHVLVSRCSALSAQA